MEEALYERNMIQFFRKKTIIFNFEAGDRRYIVTCLSQSQSKKKKIIAQVDDEVSRRGKKESEGP